jgi:adenine-specific DNA-methyltransferase
MEEFLRIRSEVSSEKLRGGFYTPEELVRFCWSRVADLVGDAPNRSLSVLEPSAGSGNFFRYLEGHRIESKIKRVHAIELLKCESAKCEITLRKFDFNSRVVNGSILNGSRPKNQKFDVSVGNPPYVRYQFIDDLDLAGIGELTADMKLKLTGVSNLWIPMVLAALEPLREGGAFAFVIPTEFLTGISASVFREWVVENISNLQLDFFAPNSFPGVLQEVLVFSGIKSKSLKGSLISIVDNGTKRKWTHNLEKGHHTWTHLYLPPKIWAAVEEAKSLSFVPLNQVAKLSVATVTGANQFFCVTDATLEEFSLHKWAKPLLPRSRYVKGLVSNSRVNEKLTQGGAARWLLDFSSEFPAADSAEGAIRYMQLGESLGLHERYKTRIRSRWFEVPIIRPGRLLFSKRSHYFPKLLFNDYGHHTTDTIYSGGTLDNQDSTAKSIVGSFHNSLSLLSAELEGRSFGGGVLELVPSEIARLVVPTVKLSSDEFKKMNIVSSSSNDSGEDLVFATNELIAGKLPELLGGFFDDLESARQLLLSRRINRF